METQNDINTQRDFIEKTVEGVTEKAAGMYKRGVPTGEFDNDWKISYKLSLRAESLSYTKLMNYMA